LTRDDFWELLSDDDVGSACAVETAFGVSDGDDYLDLRHSWRAAQGSRSGDPHRARASKKGHRRR
jgi:hypothetical protein